MTVFLTGGTGFLGGSITRALAARGHRLIRFSRGATRSQLPGRPIDGDIRDRDAIERAADGCDAVVHAAALVSIWQRRRHDFDDVNVGGLENVLAVSSARRIQRIVYVSSFLARPPRGTNAPLEANDYQRTKVVADRLADLAVSGGAPIVRVYPGVIYGPGRLTEGNLVGRLIRDHLAGRLPGLIGPENPWSFSYVDDVATGLCEALERGLPGMRYELGGENAPLHRAFEIVKDLTGRKEPRRIPFPVAEAIGAVEELRARLFGTRPMVTRGAVEIFRHDWSLDSGAAERGLGYAITPLADGIRRTVAAL